MTLLQVEELTRYWIDHPPLHLLIAAYLGAGGQDRRAALSRGQGAAARGMSRNALQLLNELGPAFINGDVHAGLGTVVLGVRELQRKTEPDIEKAEMRA